LSFFFLFINTFIDHIIIFLYQIINNQNKYKTFYRFVVKKAIKLKSIKAILSLTQLGMTSNSIVFNSTKLFDLLNNIFELKQNNEN
jgi:hypothetical protein